MVQNDNFLVKNGLLSAISWFQVQNDGKYLPQKKTRETRVVKDA